MKEIIIIVEGMMCGGCENRIQKALKDIEGVAEVVASHTEKRVKVLAKERVEEQTISDRIEDIGFKVV